MDTLPACRPSPLFVVLTAFAFCLLSSCVRPLASSHPSITEKNTYPSSIINKQGTGKVVAAAKKSCFGSFISAVIQDIRPTPNARHANRSENYEIEKSASMTAFGKLAL